MPDLRPQYDTDVTHMTVGDLVAMRQLGCETLAGAGGLDHKVVWAHVCELKDPWNWLSSDELLLTTGMCIPAKAAGQVELIRNLSRAGIAGIAIGDDMQAPPLSPAMFAEADSHSFPVLSVQHATPFSVLGRSVALAAQGDQVQRLMRLSRLYEIAKSATLSDAPRESLLESLSREFGYEFHVIDVELGSELLARTRRLDDAVVKEVFRQLEQLSSRLPARMPIAVEDRLIATAFSLPTHRKCVLVAQSDTEVDVDAFGLMQVQSLLGMEVERAEHDRERADQAGADVLAGIIHGGLETGAAEPRLEQSGIPRGRMLVAGCDGRHLSICRILLADRGIATISCAVGEEAYVLLSADDLPELLDTLTGHVPNIGVSAPTSSVQHLPDSVRQARWALQAALAEQSEVAEYTTAAPLFFPRTLNEAHFAARSVLGALIDYDAQNQSNLLETIETFLTLDRSWTATAEKLTIHRQSLAYRLRKIESLTGRSTKSTADISAMWMALVALRVSRNDLD